MKRIMTAGIIFATGLLLMASRPASAGFINATATMISAIENDGVTYDYTITLSNAPSSADPIGTFWFAWLPGKDFMVNKPLTETIPPGWKATVIGGNGANGYSIQWLALSAGADVAIGTSMDFSFRSLETPSQLTGNSPAYPGTPELTSVLYSAAPFSSDSLNFLVQPAAVPEPSTMVLSLLGGLAAIGYKRIGNRLRA